jgi:hypothetical protein
VKVLSKDLREKIVNFLVEPEIVMHNAFSYTRMYGPRYGYWRTWNAYVHLRTQGQLEMGQNSWWTLGDTNPAFVECMHRYIVFFDKGNEYYG